MHGVKAALLVDGVISVAAELAGFRALFSGKGVVRVAAELAAEFARFRALFSGKGVVCVAAEDARICAQMSELGSVFGSNVSQASAASGKCSLGQQPIAEVCRTMNTKLRQPLTEFLPPKILAAKTFPPQLFEVLLRALVPLLLDELFVLLLLFM